MTGSGPDPEVLAAIVAAVQLVWPEPLPVVLGPRVEPAGTSWRFAGRWWSASARSGKR